MFLQKYTIVFAQIDIHQTSPQLLAAPCRHAAPRRAVMHHRASRPVQRLPGGACTDACTGPRTRRTAGCALAHKLVT